jgi:hypothetical protein
MAMATAKGEFTGLNDQQKATFAGLGSNLFGAGCALLVVGVASLVLFFLRSTAPLPETGLAFLAGVAALLTGMAARFLSTTPFEEAQRPALGKQASTLGIVGVVLVGLGLLGALTGVLTLFLVGAVGLLSILEGALTAFLGLVLLAASADLGYLASTRGYEAAHTANATSSLRTFFNTVCGLTTLMLLVAVIRWWLFLGD